MLYFRDYHWLLVHGYSHFQAYITPQQRKPEQVTWFLNLRYEATGPAWRRVTHRPQVWLEVSSFRPPSGSWKDLENTSYWDLPTEDDWWPFHKRGFLDFSFFPNHAQAEKEISTGIGDHLWRVATREGRWFTVEMALLSDDYQPEELETLPALVSPAGEPLEEEALRWKEQAELYLIENIPFGTVYVRVPRNARDVETYAMARAEALIGGLGEPEKIKIIDQLKRQKDDAAAWNEISVELHYHGRYES
jgi:hypothetical protein